MPKKLEQCPQLKYRYYGRGDSAPGYPDSNCASEDQSRIYYCKVLRDVTSFARPLEPERLARDCRGNYKRCLIPSGLKAESLRVKGDAKVDIELLESLDARGHTATRLLNQVNTFLKIPPAVGYDIVTTDANFLALYNTVRPDRKIKRNISTTVFANYFFSSGVKDLKGFSIRSFKLLDDYLMQRGLISESVFVDDK